MTGPALAPAKWPGKAACMDADRTLFFPPEGEGDAARVMREMAARQICAGCPFTGGGGLCATWVIQEGDWWSFSGGMTPDERRALKPQSAYNAARAGEAAARAAALEAVGFKDCTCCPDEANPRPLDEFTRDGRRWRPECKKCRNAAVRTRRNQVAS